jgi:hypothetical protein
MSWRLFLWANNWTDDEYQQLRDEDAFRTLDANPIAEIKVIDEQRWVRLENFPEGRGRIRLIHETNCPDYACGSFAPYGFVPEAGCPKHD